MCVSCPCSSTAPVRGHAQERITLHLSPPPRSPAPSTGSPTKRAVKMVPLEALHAAERARDDVTREKAALQVG